MKWIIESLIGTNKAQFIDGDPLLNFPREGLWQTWRLSTPYGFLDIIEGDDKLHLNDKFFIPGKDSVLSIKLTVDTAGNFVAEVGGSKFLGKLKPLPTVDETYLDTFEQMFKSGLVPYAKLPDAPGKSIEELQALGAKYFPHLSARNSFLMALAIYDWTTADFDRVVLFTQFCHTAIDGRPLDSEGIIDAIWTSHWQTYNPQDAYFMASFLMKPANSRQEVADQLKLVASRLYDDAKAETRILSTAMQCMPPVATKLTPRLYSGQVDIGNLTTAHFAPGFFELPLNADASASLKMDLTQSLNSFMGKGKVITSKKVISFADTMNDALHYQNGIILIAEPGEEDLTWDTSAFVTPISDDPKKIEYTFPAGAKFLIKDFSEQIIDKKKLFVITLRPVGCLDPDLVASDKAIPVAEPKQEVLVQDATLDLAVIPTPRREPLYPRLETSTSVTVAKTTPGVRLFTASNAATSPPKTPHKNPEPTDCCNVGCCPIL